MLPHLLEILMVDGADVLSMIGEGDKIVALELMIVVLHGGCEAADDGFCDVFVLGLGRFVPACDEVLIVDGADRVEVH